jgi:hypothetical protein
VIILSPYLTEGNVSLISQADSILIGVLSGSAVMVVSSHTTHPNLGVHYSTHMYLINLDFHVSFYIIRNARPM